MNNKMEINKKNALKLWDERYPGKDKVTDFSGRVMTKGQYAVTTSKSGWNVDHRQPQANGGTNHKNNLELVNCKTNQEKADKITFTANGKKYQVKKDPKNNDGYSYIIVEVKNQNKNIEVKKQISKEDIFELFDETIIDNKDFAGEIVIKEHYKKDTEFGWDIGYYTNDKSDIKKCYIANNTTLFYYSGKTSFKIEDCNYRLKKINNKYEFVNEDKIDNLQNHSNIMMYINKIMNDDLVVYYDFLDIKFKLDCYNDDFKFKLLDIIHGICHSSNLIYNIELYDFNYSYEVDFKIRFNTPSNDDTITVNQIAMIMSNIQQFLDEYINNVTIHHTTIRECYSDLTKYSNSITTKISTNDYIAITMDEEVYTILVNNGNYSKKSFVKHESYRETFYERSYSYANFKNIMKYFK